ncbi:Gfo/Idh/MocA family oxidoreductase [Geoalkalibacter halelectricus]|uniref:Gfo/Idh/MocA family oxidoreductase n=1 Tax=Geoalkalibacter halelectricus TaxID=2847045 RepID=A0ABY5ZGA4_9BACT|nr:Gfo/Idh/MocA family oxidoreductase [Geoalkalibacter halelectricus]MDO3379574.1 Gfo/Idh/MocA family oxidoreductase [Geoalkalibacter halelectricus]UWZ78162.1 Gfo/Idh/MocA family oxidoreductase [Geoalkalibacter halelectricus]
MSQASHKKDPSVQKNFALIGAAGYIAPRHMRAIVDTGNRLVAALDKSDSVGILDSFSYDIAFFTEFERFDRHAEKLRRQGEDKRFHYVSICSPNYLHDAHIRFALRIGADAICEKPLVLNPWNLDALAELEAESGRRIFNILQLRVHPALLSLKKKIEDDQSGKRHQVDLSYITSRGNWYFHSWKGDVHKSGGVVTNIGIHFFDMLMWIFGGVESFEVHLHDERRMAGFLSLKNADVRWFLSVDHQDLPDAARAAGKSTFRSVRVDGQEVEFSEGFVDLHTVVYQEILAGRGFGIEEARPSIELVHNLRNAEVRGVQADTSHPLAVVAAKKF